MTRRAALARRVLPWLAAWLGLRGAIALTGWLVARRVDVGDESTATIRRTRAAGGLRLRPRHPHLARVRLDLVMSGGELDLTAVPQVDGGIDVTVHLVMSGLAIRLPAGRTVWWSSSGPGQIGIAEGAGVTRTDDERGADLRIHAHLWFAGLGVEGPRTRGRLGADPAAPGRAA
jgi:hypothetical protein